MVRRGRRNYPPEDNPDDYFDDSFIVEGTEIFNIDGKEIEVEDALHVIKDGRESVLISDELYEINQHTEVPIYYEYSQPAQQKSSILSGIVGTILTFILIAAISFAVIYFIAGPFIIGITHGSPETTSNAGISDTLSAVAISPTTQPTEITYLKRSYSWTYDSHKYTYSISVPEPLYDYFRKQPHDRNYAKYAISDKDRKVLGQIASTFEKKTSGDSPHESAYNVIAFVQSLPYFKDRASTGYDEYPRYPIETLVDKGGDCEDTAILTAALLKEMNYDVVLLLYPTHMAVGVTCNGCKGTYYTHHDKKYFYLETTSSGNKVGDMPSKYKDLKVRIYDI
jgi:hypothetical protein